MTDSLDAFGLFLMANLRDRGLAHFENLAAGRLKRKRRQISRTTATTASRSPPVIAGKIGRLMVRRQTSLATGRCSGTQP